MNENMNPVNMLQQTYITYLADIIKAKTKDENLNIETPMDILMHTNSLAVKKDICKPEENNYYLPLSIKRILAFILFGNEYIVESPKVTDLKPGISCTATCSIKKYVNGQDVVVASSTSTVFYYTVEPAAEVSLRNIRMEQYAIGSAESLAWNRCGIGLQYAYDLEFLGKETPPDGTDPSQNKTVLGLGEAENQMLDSILQEADEALQNMTEREPEKAIEPESLPILFGGYAGKNMTLGEIQKVAPKYIPWMLHEIHSNKVICLNGKEVRITPDYIKALETIIENNQQLKTLYESLYAA